MVRARESYRSTIGCGDPLYTGGNLAPAKSDKERIMDKILEQAVDKMASAVICRIKSEIAESMVEWNVRLTKIEDHLTAHDEREKTRAAINELESGGGKPFDTVDELIADLDLPSITSELEAGLIWVGAGKMGAWYTKAPDGTAGSPCTYTLLPTAKYEEFTHSKWNHGQDGINFRIREWKTTWLFHDIPVWPYPGDKTIYGTEAI